MDALTTFENETLNASIRVVEVDGEPWFVAQDVCPAIGLRADHGRYSHHIRYHLDPDERMVMGRTALAIPGPGGPMSLISESGLYKLIMRLR